MATTTETYPATFTIAGDITVNRLGYGAMRITGDGIWGRPRTTTRASACCGAPWSWALTSSTPPTATGPTYRKS